jgi:mannose-1-phosphate guanylyltransferase/mannose-6-phosphate isomerase
MTSCTRAWSVNVNVKPNLSDTLHTTPTSGATDGPVIIGQRIERPWGSYEVLATGLRYLVKRLTVLPSHRLSLQSHQHREEHWVIARGTATVTIHGGQRFYYEGHTVHIGYRAKHRLANEGRVALEVIETQIGDYLGEDDITRYVDDYDRPVSSV